MNPVTLAKLRAVLSSLLLIVFILVVFTGIGLFLVPDDAGLDWSFMGLHKPQLERLHTLTGFLMSGLVVIHLTLNYQMFLGEIKMLFKK